MQIKTFICQKPFVYKQVLPNYVSSIYYTLSSLNMYVPMCLKSLKSTKFRIILISYSFYLWVEDVDGIDPTLAKRWTIF